MKKIPFCFSIICIFFIGSLSAQTKDSLSFSKYVQNNVSDSLSPFFYPTLLEKARNAPSQIDLADSFFLYYGKLFQEGYNPILVSAIPRRPSFDKAVFAGKCKKILEIGETILAEDPAELMTLLHVSNCIRDNGYSDDNGVEQRFKNMIEAILSTGDGATLETAIKIIRPEHDYILKGILGFLGGTEQLHVESSGAYSVWIKGEQKLYFEDLWIAK